MSAAIAINQTSQTAPAAGRAMLVVCGAVCRMGALAAGGLRAVIAVWCKSVRVSVFQAYDRHGFQFNVTLTGRLPAFGGFPGRVGRQGSG